MMKKRLPRKIKKSVTGMSTRNRSLLQEEVKTIKFDNGVTMKFVPYYDPETGKTY